MLKERSGAETYHAWVRREMAASWIRAGWIALNSLDDTPHGVWSVHCVWDGPGEPVVPLVDTGHA